LTARTSSRRRGAIGFPYVGKVWREVWPKAIGNFVAACEATGARMVFIDNLYMYGPQTAPLIETMPLTSYGAKPAARSVATRIWMEAATAGRPRRGAARARLLRTEGRPLLARRYGNRRHGQGQGRLLRRIAGHSP
jgi:hypothetical protein